MKYVHIKYNDIINLTRVIQAEAGRTATPEHMAAIAGMILNRVAHQEWGDSISDILNPDQFASIPFNRDGGLGAMPYPTAEQMQETIAALDILRKHPNPDFRQATYNANPGKDGANYFGGTHHDLFTIADTEGTHVFVGPRRFNSSLPDVPNYSASYDTPALNLANKLRGGARYKEAMMEYHNSGHSTFIRSDSATPLNQLLAEVRHSTTSDITHSSLASLDASTPIAPLPVSANRENAVEPKSGYTL